MATNEIAGITLAVDVAQVDKGTQSLQKFRQANEQAATGINSFINAELVAKTQARDTARQLDEQRKSFASLQRAIDPTAAKLQKLQKAATDLDKAFESGVIPDEEFFRLGEVLETQINKLKRSKTALSEEGRAALQASIDKEKATATAQKFIQSLENEANAATMTRTELLQLKAAQLGVSDKAAPIIDRIGNAAESSAVQLQKQSSAFVKSGLSAGQYKQAIRQLPAQITDIGTSLAGGIPIWLIAIQQGGQIKDSFGGIANTARFALAAINPLTAVVGTLGLALGALGVAAYQADKNTRGLASTITLVGNSTITSTAQINQVVDGIERSTLATRGLIQEIANSLVASGNLTLTQIDKITKATAQWATVTSTDSKTILEYFDKITKDPVKGLAELDKQFNFLQPGQLKYIENIRKTAGETAAASAATEIFAEVMENRLDDVALSLSPLETAWNSFRKFVSEIWDAIGKRTLGALNLITDVVAGTIEQIRMLINSGDIILGEFAIAATKTLQSIPGLGDVGNEVIAEQQKVVDAAKKQNDELAKSIAERDARIRKGELGYIDSNNNINLNGNNPSTDKEFESRRKQLKDELDAIIKNRTERGKAERDLTLSYESGVLALQAQLKVLQEHKKISDVISNERKQLFQEEAKFAILEQRQADGTLTKSQAKLLAQKNIILEQAKQKAELGDQIVLQERSNKLLDDNLKKTVQIKNEANNVSLAANLSDREKQRAKELQALQSNQVNKGGSVDDTDFQALLEARRNFYAQEDALRENWLAGVNQSFANWAESATDAFSIAGSLTTKVFEGITDQITDLVTTGETNFREFTVNILKQIARIATQLLIVKAIESSLSSFGGTGGAIGSIASAIGGGFASGGYTGDGGKYQPAGTVHKGEFVFTKEATSRIGVKNLYALMRGYANGGVVGGPSGYANGGLVSGGADVNVSGITVNVNSGIGSDPEQAKALQNGVKAIVAEEIAQSFQQGGRAFAYLRGFN
ncbi:phage tail tape measure protein [Nitratidesulfovibrio liaohensis]|uniref:phage tail tape measure protein n=1 Tax=Nitratidesulfovibrio liaohensis TaxID=2604158 RepID=UPI00141ED375|nr:phage tail tape measure protein [Nitratidesulfovibrio liaohensis]NHZ46696.1 phage tail tape measure protein [Nitratidesulfovibrio liaohensis]